LLPFFALGLDGYRSTASGRPLPGSGWLAAGSARPGNFDLIRRRGAPLSGISILEGAIGGLSAMPTVGSVIAGATSAEQVKQNVAAAQWVPSGDDLEVLLEITKPAL
jgi:aryl-alcohol dehydrogenase-like predicted oxidoreductase